MVEISQDVRSSVSTELEQKIRDKSAVIGVIGLGYVGLPLAVTFAEAGFRVIGFDSNADRVRMVNAHKSYTVDVVSERLERLSLQATGDMTHLREVDVVLICVPTPFTEAKNPDLQYVREAGNAIVLRAPQTLLIVLESTTYPGSTRKDLLPLFENDGRGLDTDFFLAFSPEMIDPGNKTFNTANTLKAVGGVTPKSTELACLLYSQICSCVVPVSSPEVAELVKVFSNTFRSVNIALVNELAQLCSRMGVSVWEVIDTAAKKQFGYMPFYPGLVSGHCIPKDPYYLSHKAMELDFHAKFIELAASINEDMPHRVLNDVWRLLNHRGKTLKDSHILVLGVAFKKDIADTRDSGSVKLLKMLSQYGALVYYNDPYVPEIAIQLTSGEAKLLSVPMTPLSRFDCVVITTDHSCYVPEDIVEQARLVYDVRGLTRHIKGADNVARLGEPI